MASGTHREEEYFPVKLFRMVEDESYSKIVWWNEDGDGFFICEDQEEFLTSKILENYNFKTHSYGSFIRQLNNYGFHKKRRPNQEKANEPSSYYCHDKGYFKRSCPDLLMNITKTKGNQGTKKETSSKKEAGRKLNQQGTNQDLLQSIKKTETDTSFENVTSGSFAGIHGGMSEQTQTQTIDILDMVVQSGQYLPDELMYDVAGEATSEKTILQTETSLIPDVRFPEKISLASTTTTLAPSVGVFDSSPFQLGGVPVPFIQQVSNWSSLSESLHEPETYEQHLIDQYPLQDQDFSRLFISELQNEVVGITYQGSQMCETGYSSEESLNQPKELGQEIAVATNVTQDPFRLYQADGNAYSSDEASSSKEQTFDVTINPESCHPEGGKCFWLEFDKSLPSSVTSAWAAFGPYGRVKIRTYDEDCTMFGKKIPPGRPGMVTVTVTTDSGESLGETVFTYKNPKKKGNNQGLPNKRKLDELSAIVKDFTKKLREFQQGDDGDESLKSAFKQGPLHQEKQLEPEKVLKALVYAAAEAGAMRLIDTIFSLPAGRVVFESYKEESSLPEEIAEENGHGKVAAYLRVKTKRYSEEESMIPVQSRIIEFDWLKLANVLEELEPSQSVTESSSDQDLNQIWEDDITGTGYSADGETSPSSSGKEISDSDDEVHKIGAFKETTTVNPRNEVVTEKQVADISDEVGTCWRQLGPRLKITESKIHNIDEENRGNWHKANALLITWKQTVGTNATVGHLADVLERIGRRSIAEKLLGESRALEMPTCAPVSVRDKIDLTVNAIQDKVLFCEGAHGNMFIVKAIDTKGQWNSEKILKNKEFLEKVAATAQEMEKTEEQKLQDCLVRYSTGIEELKKEMQDCSVRYSTGIELKKEIQGQKEAKDRDDDDYDDGRPSAGTSSPERITQQSDSLLNDVKVSLQDATQLLQYCEEHKTHYNGIYNNLIKKVEEVAQFPEDNSMCVKHLCDSIKEIEDEEKKIFNPKLKRLHDLKQHLDVGQVTQVEELYKWSTAHAKQLSEVEKLLSSLLNQGNQCYSESSAGGRSSSSRKGKILRLSKMIDELREELSSVKRESDDTKQKGFIMSTRIKQLEEENLQLRAKVEFKGEHEQRISQFAQVSKMCNKPREELEEQLSIARNKCRKKEEEDQGMSESSNKATEGTCNCGGSASLSRAANKTAAVLHASSLCNHWHSTSRANTFAVLGEAGPGSPTGSTNASSGYFSFGFEPSPSTNSLPSRIRNELILILDPPLPKGDWRSLAQGVGFEVKFIRWLASRNSSVSPTDIVLTALESKRYPLCKLAEKLHEIGRGDAASLVAQLMWRETEV